MAIPSLKDLAALSKSLNEASDVLSKQIAQVETALNELRLGVGAWVTINTYETDDEFTVNGKPETVTKVESLGYGKHHGKWCLLFSTSYEERPDPHYETVVPLRDAPRLERIAAVDKFPALLRKIESEAREVASLATTKAAEVAQFATALHRAAQ